MTGCALGNECSWGGLGEATLEGAAFGTAFGLGFGAAADLAEGSSEEAVSPGCSFTADTKVQLADGNTKDISALKPGDKVKSTDTTTGKTDDSTTSAVWVNHDTDLYDLSIHTASGDQVIHTTANHRFYDHTTHSWVEAAKLRKGDQLTTDDGTTATVEGGTTPADSTGVLVHNACKTAYTVAYETTLDAADIPTDRPTHFRAANTKLLNDIMADDDFKQLMEQITGRPDLVRDLQARTGRVRSKPPKNWTWQHATKSQAQGRIGVLQLVPRVEHTPGSPWWRVLHPLPGAAGGYSEWAIPLGAKKN